MKKGERFPIMLSNEGREALRQSADEWGMRESDIIRLALKLYFQARGKSIDFKPPNWGGKRAKSE